MVGGEYDWVGIADVTSDVHTQFLSDVSIALNTSYKDSGSESHIQNVAQALSDIYHFTNVWFSTSNSESDWPLRAIAANLVVSNSVVLAVANVNAKGEVTARRTVIADGYGYKDDTLYVHLNMGQGGKDDGWYTMPIATNGYNKIEASVINVNPFYTTDEQAALAGRVVDERGDPLAGAKVEVVRRTGALL